jgi:hypothetical protein
VVEVISRVDKVFLVIALVAVRIDGSCFDDDAQQHAKGNKGVDDEEYHQSIMDRFRIVPFHEKLYLVNGQYA